MSVDCDGLGNNGTGIVPRLFQLAKVSYRTADIDEGLMEWGQGFDPDAKIGIIDARDGDTDIAGRGCSDQVNSPYTPVLTEFRITAPYRTPLDLHTALSERLGSHQCKSYEQTQNHTFHLVFSY